MGRSGHTVFRRVKMLSCKDALIQPWSKFPVTRKTSLVRGLLVGVDSPMVARIIVDVTFKNHTTVGRVNVSEE